MKDLHEAHLKVLADPSHKNVAQFAQIAESHGYDASHGVHPKLRYFHKSSEVNPTTYAPLGLHPDQRGSDYLMTSFAPNGKVLHSRFTTEWGSGPAHDPHMFSHIPAHMTQAQRLPMHALSLDAPGYADEGSDAPIDGWTHGPKHSVRFEDYSGVGGTTHMIHPNHGEVYWDSGGDHIFGTSQKAIREWLKSYADKLGVMEMD